MSNTIKVVPTARKNFILWSIIIPAIVLVFFFSIAIIANFTYKKNKQYFKETTATITYIDVVIKVEEGYSTGEYQSEGTIEHVVYVDYTVDGEVYQNVRYNKYSADMRVGDKITVEYDTRNPSKIQTQTNLAGIIIVVLFIATIIYIVIIVSSTKKSRKRIAKIKETGECYRLKITEVVNPYLVDINPRLEEEPVPQKVLLKIKYKDAVYFSEPIKYTKDVKVGDMVDLYIDSEEAKTKRHSRVNRFRKTQNKVKNYYVDIYSISHAE